MREAIISNCEKEFILKAISEGQRLDGRNLTDYRRLNICFGKEFGCCHVSLGETRILAQVSCEIQQPKATRPNEGLLHINVGLSPMGAPHFETGRQSDTSIELNRLLEKCIKDSKCVDLESLCIVAEEKVWMIRVDLNILNHEGNLIDCASIAALSALSHFRRPDVELDGDQVKIFEPSVKDLIPLAIKHFPICVSFAIFSSGKNCVVDPSDLEERIAEAQLTLGVNGYRELCGVYLVGSTPGGPELVKKCANKAANRAIEVINQIKNTIAEDTKKRLIGSKSIGLTEGLKDGNIRSINIPHIRLENKQNKNTENLIDMEEEETKEIVIKSDGPGSAVIGVPEIIKIDSESSDSDEDEIQFEKEIQPPQKKQHVEDNIEMLSSDDSEEEKTVTVVSEYSKIKDKSKGRKKKK